MHSMFIPISPTNSHLRVSYPGILCVLQKGPRGSITLARSMASFSLTLMPATWDVH